MEVPRVLKQPLEHLVEEIIHVPKAVEGLTNGFQPGFQYLRDDHPVISFVGNPRSLNGDLKGKIIELNGADDRRDFTATNHPRNIRGDGEMGM